MLLNWRRVAQDGALLAFLNIELSYKTDHFEYFRSLCKQVSGVILRMAERHKQVDRQPVVAVQRQSIVGYSNLA